MQMYFENRVRVRVCGVLIYKDSILLVKHKSIGAGGVFWCPPGGGVSFGETLAQALIREFLEETSLHIEVGSLITHSEYISNTIHSIDFFYNVHSTSIHVQKGFDPEQTQDEQLIEEVRWAPFTEISTWPKENYHPILEDIIRNRSK